MPRLKTPHYYSSLSSILPHFLFSFFFRLFLWSIFIFFSYYTVKILREGLQTILSASFLDPSQAFLGLHFYYNTNHLTLKSDQKITLEYLHFSNLVSAPVSFVLQIRAAYRVQARYRCCIIACLVCLPLSIQELRLSFWGVQSHTSGHSPRQIPLSFQFYCYSCLSPVIFSCSSCPIFCFSLIGSLAA